MEYNDGRLAVDARQRFSVRCPNDTLEIRVSDGCGKRLYDSEDAFRSLDAVRY